MKKGTWPSGSEADFNKLSRKRPVVHKTKGVEILTPLTLRELQEQLPWTLPYSAEFRRSLAQHKDLQHALIHVMKSAGKLAAMCDDADHGRVELRTNGGKPFPGCASMSAQDVADCVSNFVICALRMANSLPHRFDLASYVEARIEKINGVKLRRPRR